MSATESEIEQQDAAAREAVAQLRTQITRADPDTMRLLLTEARTHNGWQDRDVSDATLRELYDMAKMGPTSMNQQPLRIVFVRSAEAKEKLKPTLMGSNQDKTMAAPVCAILGHDLKFYEHLPKIFPPNPNAKGIFEGNDAAIQSHAFRNGTLQAAWFMIAARAVGLDCGAMSGFDNAKVDELFFAGTSVKSNFLCNLGYADESKVFRRLPRFEFDEVVTIV